MKTKASILPHPLLAYPELRFASGDEFLFDAADDIIYYVADAIDQLEGQLALLHEIAHAKLGHFHYASDFELFAMETQAWRLTRHLALTHDLIVPRGYIEDCLDTYNTWLTKRATCPACHNFSTQEDEVTYRCFMCDTRWRVTIDALERTRRVKL